VGIPADLWKTFSDFRSLRNSTSDFSRTLIFEDASPHERQVNFKLDHLLQQWARFPGFGIDKLTESIPPLTSQHG